MRLPRQSGRRCGARCSLCRSNSVVPRVQGTPRRRHLHEKRHARPRGHVGWAGEIQGVAQASFDRADFSSCAQPPAANRGKALEVGAFQTGLPGFGATSHPRMVVTRPMPKMRLFPRAQCDPISHLGLSDGGTGCLKAVRESCCAWGVVAIYFRHERNMPVFPVAPFVLGRAPGLGVRQLPFAARRFAF